MNGAGLLLVYSLAVGFRIKFLAWTFQVHRHNTNIRRRMSAGAYEEFTK